MIIMFPVMFSGGGMYGPNPTTAIPQPSHGTWWKGELWYPAISFGGPLQLHHVQPDAPAESADAEQQAATVSVPSAQVNEAWLLGGEDRLWILSAEAFGYMTDDGETTVLRSLQTFTDMTNPFLYEGRPAVIDYDGESYVLYTLEDGEWIPEGRVAMTEDDASFYGTIDRIRIVQAGGTDHVFLETGGIVCHREGLTVTPVDEQAADEKAADEQAGQQTEAGAAPGDAAKALADWNSVADVYDSEWAATVVEGAPTVFYSEEGGTGDVVGIAWSDGEREEVFRQRLPVWQQGMGVYAVPDSDRIVLITSLPHRVFLIENGRVVQENRRAGFLGGIGENIEKQFAVSMIANGAVWVLLAAYVVALTWMMATWRDPVCPSVAGPAEYASILRRSIGHGIDSLIIWLPSIPLSYYLMSKLDLEMIIFDFKDGFLPLVLDILPMLAAVMGWALLMF
ncbi:MAG: hypothetical protein ACREIV_09535, partial [Planctomycetaceae bacterium]